MKYLYNILLAVAIGILMSSCFGYGDNDPITQPVQNNYKAVIMARPAFEAAVQLIPVQSIAKSGKIYVMGNLLFINDVNKGFHIYNYLDAQNPQPIGFLKIPGATDLAMRNNIMFINQATDLVAIQYNAGTNTINVTNRNRNVFPQKPAPDSSWEPVAEDEVIIGWEHL